MVRPCNFGFNQETASSNSFQNNLNLRNAQQLALNEFDEMVTQLTASNIKVKVFEDKNNDTPDSIFPNNWIANLPSGEVTIFPMYTKNRRREIRTDIIDFIKSESNSNKLIDLTEEVDQHKFLEGTGSIVFNHAYKIAFACESLRTDIALFEAYCSKINHTAFSFQAVDLDGELIYHTNVVMTITSKCAIVCFDAVQNILEREMLKQKLVHCQLEIISISYLQMNAFAGNCFEVLNDKNISHLLMSTTAFNVFSDDQLKILKTHHQILAFEIPTIEKIGGGGVRCMVAGVFAQA